jgi:hypothetical protein
VRPAGNPVDPGALKAIQDALLNGGPGKEFGAILRRNLLQVMQYAQEFQAGTRTEATLPGMIVALPEWQPRYTGRHLDNLVATAAGAVVTKANKVLLGAVVRGLYDEPTPSYMVFGIDRGAGSKLNPRFSIRPSIRPDLLVTVKIGPFGKGNSGTITDLTTGKTTAFASSRIVVEGATVRVTLDPSQLPSKGLPLTQYRFAAWPREKLTGGFASVGNFLPNRQMIRFGVE